MNRTTHEWIVSGPAFCRPQVDRTSNRPTTTTSGVGQPVEDPGPTSTPSTAPYAPSIPVPRDLCPCGFEIQAGLIPRMIRDLPNLLQGTPNPSADAIEQAWSYACDFARSKEIRNEADVVGFWGFLLSGLSRTCQVLGVPASAHRENVDTMVNVRMDIAMESSGQRRVAIVLKRDSVVIACRRGWSDLVGKEWLGWNGRAVVTGAKSVIIKLALWMAAEGVQWGLVATAQRYRVVWLTRRRVGEVKYPYIVMSEEFWLDSSDPSPLQILLYMFLQAPQTEPDGLLELLTAAVPYSDPYAHPPGSIRLESRVIEARNAIGIAKTSHLPDIPENMESILLCFPIDSSGLRVRDMRMTRRSTVRDWWDPPLTNLNMIYPPTPSGSPKSVGASSTLSSHLSDNTGPSVDAGPTVINLHDHRAYIGGGGLCYRGSIDGQDVVLKFAHGGKEDMVMEEARVYEKHGRHLGHPRFYGLFKGENSTAMVVEWRGKALDSFNELDLAEKEMLFDRVVSMHRHGLQHGDLEPRNVTKMPDDGTLTIIDFSHAWEHECPGMERCSELQDFAFDLGLSHLRSASRDP